MKFDKWFNKQSLLVKLILLLIPGVNGIVEILVRLSVALRTKNLIHIVMLLLSIFASWFYVIEIIDIIGIVLYGKMFLVD
ncbi:MAG: hypothetical protein J6Q38_01470 [Clostridia bacterium]|nr:hypothetical protein [Clostridia bacterium]